MSFLRRQHLSYNFFFDNKVYRTFGRLTMIPMRASSWRQCRQLPAYIYECASAMFLGTQLYYITGESAPIFRSVKQVKPKTWRILGFADVISVTTDPKFSCELRLTGLIS